MKENRKENPESIIKSLQLICDNEVLLAKVIDFLPYPIHVYDTEGNSVMVNKAILSNYHVKDPSEITGWYNVFKDPSVIALGRMDELQKAFQGETVQFTDIKVPIEFIAEKYHIKDFDVEAVYQDITLFPILNEEQKVINVVALLINKRVYRGKEEIEKAKEYIDNHWLDDFSIERIAQTVSLSKAYFSNLFKKHTGCTPHEYYMSCKMAGIKEKLLDTNLTVAQVFAECNMKYNGNTAKAFKEKVGLSPSSYRKLYKTKT